MSQISRDALMRENIAKFMADGAELRTDYNRWIEAKDSASRMVLLAGLGSMGVGVMWIKDDLVVKDYPGYEDAPERVMEHDDELAIWNALNETHLLRMRGAR